jgi:hypothetical protein
MLVARRRAGQVRVGLAPWDRTCFRSLRAWCARWSTSSIDRCTYDSEKAVGGTVKKWHDTPVTSGGGWDQPPRSQCILAQILLSGLVLWSCGGRSPDPWRLYEPGRFEFERTGPPTAIRIVGDEGLTAQYTDLSTDQGPRFRRPAAQRFVRLRQLCDIRFQGGRAPDRGSGPG